METDAKRRWWKEAVVYQIYPASFLDRNGDGLGDIRGITSKVDYLKELGVDVIWLSPIYDSPQADMGYDISNYKEVYPPYGTLADVDELIHELTRRRMKLVMDLVVNHTSNKHPWFLESRSSKTSPMRDWYIWKPPTYDEQGNRNPPNNWGQILGEANSVWVFDPHTSEYYLALFTPGQPDLNWQNPAVREAVYDVQRFWLDRGVAGFRMDVINLISKDTSFPNAQVVMPKEPFQPGMAHYANGPHLHEYLEEMKRKVLDKYDIMTVGEMPFVNDEEEILRVVHQQSGTLNMIFVFELVEIDARRGDVPGDFRMSVSEWTVRDLKRVVGKWQRLMIDRGGWNSLFLENHDQPRSVSRFCDDSDEYRDLGSKLLCLMETTLGGTLFIYQGEELGMRNVPSAWGPEEYKDVESVNYWEKVNAMYPNNKDKLAYAMTVLQKKARDNARTPIQWENSPNAGFCPADVRPWMRVNDDYGTVNAADQLARPEKDSVFQFWQRCLRMRKEMPHVFVYGDFQAVDESHPSVFAFLRCAGAETWMTALNFSGTKVAWGVTGMGFKVAEWVIGNYPKRIQSGELGDEVWGLEPWECLLARVVR